MGEKWLASIGTCLVGVPSIASDAAAAVTKEMIPLTGDASRLALPIVGGVLAVSAVLLIIYMVLSKRKK